MLSIVGLVIRHESWSSWSSMEPDGRLTTYEAGFHVRPIIILLELWTYVLKKSKNEQTLLSPAEK